MKETSVTGSSADTVRGVIAAWAERTPGRPAVLAPGRDPLSFAGLAEQLEGVSSALRRAGVRRADRIASVLPNGPETAVIYAAATSTAVFAPLNPNYREAEYEFYLEDLRPRALIVEEGAGSPAIGVAGRLGIPVLSLRPLVERGAGACELIVSSGAGEPAPETCRPEDTALVLHTSGTTSRPKIVPLTHRNLCASAANIVRSFELTERDRSLTVMPLFHIHGLVASLLASWHAGGSVAVPSGFDAGRFFEWIREFRPTWYTATPTVHQAVLRRAKMNPKGLESHTFRFVRSCSSPLPPTVMQAIEETFGVPAIESLGMTEAAHQIASNPLPPGARKPGSVGLPAGPEVAVWDGNGTPLPAGKTGEIVIRGDNVTGGYEGNTEANDASFSGGWFRTGDEGYLDEDGYLYLTGRLKEMINHGGEKIAPREIDELLLTHPAIEQAVAFAVPHAQLGEVVGAAVVLQPGKTLDAGQILEFVTGKVSDFKLPRVIRMVDRIPKGPTGKLRRIGLAETLNIEPLDDAGAGEEAPFVEPRTELERKLAAIWGEVLGVDRPGVRDNFFTLGGHSLLARLSQF